VSAVPAGEVPVGARAPGLDVFRGVAVLMMFVVHARRLQPPRAATGIDAVATLALDGFGWGEPFIAASFLAIAGTSLVFARRRTPELPRWWRRLGARAVSLYLLAVALFIPQFGVALPDLLLSPGILSVIALATAVVGGALALARPVAALLGVLGGALLMTALLERTGACLSGLNAGPGGAVPLLGFTAAGALLGLGYLQRGARAVGAAAAVSAVGTLAVVALGVPWTTRCDSLYPAHDGLVAVLDLLHPAPEREAVAFWNHSTAGFVGLVPAVAGALWIAVALPWPSRGLLAGGGLVGLLGRHALAAYVGHLLLLGVLELSGLTPRTATATWALVGALAVTATLASAALQARRRGRLRESDATHGADGGRSRLSGGSWGVVAPGRADSSEERP